ncbi:Toxin YoeB [Corynebacterium capitovis DSM 44611]|uniref:Txe/YoeB family addiction module toxin n=1 Tax=Corynebacterium capitovis TaxID=131081 RepID=UPI0003657D93|nr:Txe/YoeB family addiction module toxin [Corynebacterium capitovis]WKD56677.1 Toxin YoeB [Corynebacterium capitovis DSM 44611]
MRLSWDKSAWDDYLHWQSADRKTLRRINSLIQATLRDPLSGMGKPEPLKHALAGAWSRRITAEHRLVYVAVDDEIVILQARYHY